MLLPATANGEVRRCYRLRSSLRARGGSGLLHRPATVKHRINAQTPLGVLVATPWVPPHQRPLVTNPSQNATRETEAPMKIHRGRPPDRPGGCPGRGPDLPSDPSQGEKHQASDQDLPSNHSLSTNCPASDRVSTAPNPFSLGAAPASGAPSTRVSCPAQPVGYICLPLRAASPGQTCPLGHSMEPALIRSTPGSRTTC